MVPAPGSLIKKTALSRARVRESEASEPSAGATRRGAPSVPEKRRQARRVSKAKREIYGHIRTIH